MSSVAGGVLTYHCSLCDYRTSDKSNMNVHMNRTCPEGAIRKTREAAGCVGLRARGPVPIASFAAEVLRDVVPIEDTDERSRYVFHSSSSDSILELASEYERYSVDLFIKIVWLLIGSGSPDPLQSAKVLVSRKGTKTLAWKTRDRVVTRPLEDRFVMEFLELAYETFRSVMVSKAMETHVSPEFRQTCQMITREVASIAVERATPKGSRKAFISLRDVIYGTRRENAIRNDLLHIPDYLAIVPVKRV